MLSNAFRKDLFLTCVINFCPITRFFNTNLHSDDSFIMFLLDLYHSISHLLLRLIVLGLELRQLKNTHKIMYCKIFKFGLVLIAVSREDIANISYNCQYWDINENSFFLCISGKQATNIDINC